MNDTRSKLLALTKRTPDWLDKFDDAADEEQQQLFREYVSDFLALREEGHTIGWASLEKAVNAEPRLAAARGVKSETLKRCVHARPEEFGAK